MDIFSFLIDVVKALGKPTEPKEELYTFEEAYCLMKYHGKRIQPVGYPKEEYMYYDANKNVIYETYLHKRYSNDSGWFQVRLLGTISHAELLGEWRVLEKSEK